MRLVLAMLSSILVSFASPRPLSAQQAPSGRDGAAAPIPRVRPLRCAGRSIVRYPRLTREQLRLLPDRHNVGVSIDCHADSLTISEWSVDYSGVFTVPRERAMRVWRRFAAARTYERSHDVIDEAEATESSHWTTAASISPPPSPTN